jgi:Domain of Unknown Function (DUF1543)
MRWAYWDNLYFWRMGKQKLYMLLLGCRPEGRHTEQHDVFFHIGESLESLIPAIVEFWPEAKGKIHVDAWREVTRVGDFSVSVRRRGDSAERLTADGVAAGDGEGVVADAANGPRLYFINLGGYKRDVFEEFHYKMVAVADDKGAAVRQAKATAFYHHTGFEGASSHVDDKYGIDVDDAHEIMDILPAALTEAYAIEIRRYAEGERGASGGSSQEDEMHLGYFQLAKLKGMG